MPKNQTFLKYGGNSQKINSAQIHRLDRPWCETNHDILRLAEYRFIYEKIDNRPISEVTSRHVISRSGGQASKQIVFVRGPS